VPSLCPSLSGGLFSLASDLHLHHLGERGERTSILRNRCRSSISTPWCLQSLTHMRFERLKMKIA
jgi:hypothetical protein